MKLLRLFFFVLLASFAAEVFAATNSAASATSQTGNHFFWEVKGASNSVFVVGSMHVMKDSMYPLADEIESAYKRSGIVVFESDLKALQSPAFAMKFLDKMMYPEGDELKKHISATTYSLLESNLQSSILTMDMLSQQKPWVIALSLVMLELQKEGFNSENGLDKHFHEQATADGKTLDMFEKPEFQMNLLVGLDDKNSEEFLLQSLKDLKVFKKEFAAMVKAWTSGDVKAMDALILDSFRAYPALYKTFCLDRNKNWLGKLESLLKEKQDVFVVVGAAHTIGKDSILDLLSAKGYQIKQR